MKRLIALLGWIGVALVVSAVVLLIVRPDLTGLRQGLAYGGLGVTLIYALTQWRDIARSFGGREMKYGSIAATTVVLVLGILVALNWVASRRDARWDLTANNRFSLSEQTQQILRGLDRPLTVRLFYAGSLNDANSERSYRDQIGDYAYYSNQVQTEIVDADRDPITAEKYEIATVPTVVLEYDGRTERATSTSEQTLTNALKRLVEGSPKKVYFLQGHGEVDPSATDGRGYSAVTAALRDDNFEVATLNLAQQGSIPADATVLIIAGPKTDVLPGELDAIRAFLRRGGKLQMLLDPPEKGTAPDMTGLIALARDWGIDVGNNLLIDNSGLGQQLGTGPSVPIAMPMPHPITDNFRLMTIFPVARSVRPLEGGANGHTAQPVLSTSPESWAETSLSEVYGAGTAELNADRGDLAGPVPLAAAVSAAAEEPAPAAAPTAGDSPAASDAPKPETRIVVVGDSEFISNAFGQARGNREVFLNMVNWLAQQEDLIAIRPTDPGNTPITLSAGQGLWIWMFAILIFPAMLFANGVRIWWKRR